MHADPCLLPYFFLRVDGRDKFRILGYEEGVSCKEHGGWRRAVLIILGMRP
jgi:hypothetical protein